MSQPYVGEIRMFAGNFAPLGWEFCDGQLLSISENEVLFYLIGTLYGGDGQVNFRLPDLRGRIPIHMGTGPDGINYMGAQSGGAETEVITTQQMPAHTHPLLGTAAPANERNPKNALLAAAGEHLYASPQSPVAMDPRAVTTAGASQPHDNLQPYLCVNFIISLFGVFPNQT